MKENNLNIAFFASHGGSNMQAIIDAIKAGVLEAQVGCIISNNSDSYSLKRAEIEGIKGYHISSKTHLTEIERIDYMLEILKKHDINIIVLAGYMKKLPVEVIDFVNGIVLNIHPALLPKFGGAGMFGMNVHKAVIDAKEKQSGATVHLVDSEYDRGKILQQWSVEIDENETADSLAEKVLKVEHKLYTDTLIKLSNGEISL